MKKYLFAICIIILTVIITCNPVIAQSFFWSNQIGSNSADYGRSGACDNDGNFYYAGVFEGPYCYFQTDTLVRHGINDLFLVKYDRSGKELWVHQIGGWNDQSYESVFVFYDNVFNHILIAGSFFGTVSFGSCILTARGGLDIFLAKYDLDGFCLWSKKAGGVGDDKPDQLTLDNNGHIYMCGTNSSSANFDDFVIPRGGFLAKFDQNGTCIWAKNKFEWAHTFDSQIRSGGLKIRESDIFMGGCMGVDDTIKIDAITIAHKGLGSSLICCFDSSGTAKWIREGISIATETIADIAIDGNGNIYQTGYFVDTINFNGNYLVSKPAQQEMFLVKYDKTGKFKWARQTISGTYAEGYDITANSRGNVVVVGHCRGLTQFDNFHINPISNEDMFLAGYDSSGNCQGVYNYGHGRGSGICEDRSGNLYFTFLFNPTTTLGTKSFTSNGLEDFILAKCSAITGIEEPKINLKNQLLIYANPTTGKCTITIPEEFINGKYLTLQVFDSQGKLIQQAPVETVEGKIKLNLESVCTRHGVYVTALLGNGTKSYTGKIIFR